jgi:hypothetical protein
MADPSEYRIGLKKRYRDSSATERPRPSKQPFEPYTPRSDTKRVRHLPALHLSLPYTSSDLYVLLLQGSPGGNPIVDAQITNNGNAAAMVPIVELGVMWRGSQDGVIRPHLWLTGVSAIDALYPHETASVSVTWDRSLLPDLFPKFLMFWLRHAGAICYDPILDPRPDLSDVGPGSQPPFHTKVVLLEDLEP